MGEKDEIISWEEGQELPTRIPQAEFGLIPDAGYTEVIVDQGAFLNLVLDFLARWAP